MKRTPETASVSLSQEVPDIQDSTSGHAAGHQPLTPEQRHSLHDAACRVLRRRYGGHWRVRLEGDSTIEGAATLTNGDTRERTRG